jgi:hypothetical protein
LIITVYTFFCFCLYCINKAKESLNSDDQQFTNINKTKESLNSDDQQVTNINKTKESLNNDGFVYIGELLIITV